MQSLKLILGTGCLLLLASITLLLVQLRHDVRTPHPPAPASAADPAWKYSQFHFDGYLTHELGKTQHAQLVNYDLGADGLGLRPVETNSITSADQILTDIGRDGWQYVWTDGTTYLVRRAAGSWRHELFLLEYHEAKP